MIAVLFGENEYLADFNNLKCIRVYSKNNEGFRIVKEISCDFANTSDLSEFRAFLAKIVEEIGNVKIIAGSQITGIPFHFFVRQGFEICEAKKMSEALLNQIYEDYIEEKQEAKLSTEEMQERTEAAKTPIEPIKVDEEGDYFLDFIRIQKYRPEISSKKALLPFLSNELFQTLTVICSHIMPWLENYFIQNKNMEFSYKREDGICTIIISHKICES